MAERVQPSAFSEETAVAAHASLLLFMTVLSKHERKAVRGSVSPFISRHAGELRGKRPKETGVATCCSGTPSCCVWFLHPPPEQLPCFLWEAAWRRTIREGASRVFLPTRWGVRGCGVKSSHNYDQGLVTYPL